MKSNYFSKCEILSENDLSLVSGGMTLTEETAFDMLEQLRCISEEIRLLAPEEITRDKVLKICCMVGSGLMSTALGICIYECVDNYFDIEGIGNILIGSASFVLGNFLSKKIFTKLGLI